MGGVEIKKTTLYQNFTPFLPHVSSCSAQGCKVKVLKMSAQATCKQFIANLDQS